MRKLLLALLLPLAAGAAEVEGVKVEDKTRVGSSDLVLNGAGLRKRLFFQVYVIGLYVPQKTSNAGAILEQPSFALISSQTCSSCRIEQLARRPPVGEAFT